MPPKFDTPDESEGARYAKRLQGLTLSNRTVVTVTLASALAGCMTLVSTSWVVANKTRDFDENFREHRKDLVALTAEVRNSKGRWALSHEVEAWSDFGRRNPMLKLDMPDPYAIKLKLGD